MYYGKIDNVLNIIGRMVFIWILAVIFSLYSTVVLPNSKNITSPIYDATVDTVFDVIERSDKSTFTCLQFVGRDDRKIWDKRVDNEPKISAFVFLAKFSDGLDIEIAVNPEFQTKRAAETEARFYVRALGKLPSVLRKGIRVLTIHKGNKGFHAGTGNIVVYSGIARTREDSNHLEESLFHESVHATWDKDHRLSSGWINAQKLDSQFMTRYGEENPQREDLAETALFAFALIHFPGRIPPVDAEDIVSAVPMRLSYIEKLIPKDQPLLAIEDVVLECQK